MLSINPICLSRLCYFTILLSTSIRIDFLACRDVDFTFARCNDCNELSSQASVSSCFIVDAESYRSVNECNMFKNTWHFHILTRSNTWIRTVCFSRYFHFKQLYEIDRKCIKIKPQYNFPLQFYDNYTVTDTILCTFVCKDNFFKRIFTTVILHY